MADIAYRVTHGRICADPIMLHRGALGALSVEEITRALDELEDAGFIERYEVDGIQWAWFPDTVQMPDPQTGGARGTA